MPDESTDLSAMLPPEVMTAALFASTFLSFVGEQQVRCSHPFVYVELAHSPLSCRVCRYVKARCAKRFRGRVYAICLLYAGKGCVVLSWLSWAM